ncbi:MAG: hypothetical protein M5U12_24605 [Verrucomicrobia bacterium]|nr:hypothetical protein [Verrucomicrobiota bacterium]
MKPQAATHQHTVPMLSRWERRFHYKPGGKAGIAYQRDKTSH